MTVPNRFSARRRDRDRLVRLGAIAAALVGGGVAAVLLLVVGSLIPMGVAYRVGLLVAMLAGAAWSVRLSGVTFWTPGDSLIALVLGLLWIALGVTPSMTVGAIPLVVGLAMATTGITAMTLERQSRASARPA